MKSFLFMALAALVAGADARAATSGALYDMSIFLNQPHPFARPWRPPPVAAPTPRPATMTRPGPLRPTATPVQSADAADEATGRPLWGVISEIRLGALLHDEGPFSSHKEDGGDINLEVLFTAPDFLDAVWSPRPHLGLTGHTEGDTHQAYLGLTWEWRFLRHAFVDFSLSGAVHTGETTNAPLGRKELGCRVLFRQSLDLGYRFAGRHAVMAHLSHISNAKLCDTNEGLENVGIRYGYAF